MNEQQAQRLLAKISEAIVETVNEAPNGAPCGPLYMALMHVWPSMTSLQFNMLIATLVAAGKVRRVGHCLYKVECTQTEYDRYLAGAFSGPANK